LNAQAESSTGDADISGMSANNFNSSDHLRVGSYTNATNTAPFNPFNGKLGIQRMYNRLLTQAESEQNYNAIKYRY
jgi:hypothetical protein